MEPISYTNYSWSYQGIDGAVSSQELRQARVILQNEPPGIVVRFLVADRVVPNGK